MLMPLQRPGALVAPPVWVCRFLAGVLILGAGAAHVFYLTHSCPLDLAPDEAHYWDWSRHLDWSYYSKGPLIAWIIRAGCELFGPWSMAATGTLMPAIRLPAVLCGGLLLVSLYLLTLQVTGRDGLGLAVVALSLTVPVLVAGSSLMTIDAPYTCCWGWALVLGHRAVFRGSGWAWPLAGLVVALGFLAKYTMVVFVPSLALFLLTQPERRGLLFRPGFWVMCAVAGLGSLPVLLWNYQHDWITFRHVSHLAALHDETRIHWLGPLVFVGGQFALLLGFWFAFWATAMVAHNPLREKNPGLRYLWWMSAPVFCLFWGFSLKNGGGELNWPVTTYISGLVLVAFLLAGFLESPRTSIRRWTWFNLTAASILGLAVTACMHRSDWLHPVLERCTGPATAEQPLPLRRVDPTCRLRGWRTLAAEVDRLRERLRHDGAEPVLAGTNWSLPGEMGFYCSNHPPVYSLGLLQGDRHSQYDLWDNPLENPKPFLGQTFIVVGGVGPAIAAGFDRVEPTKVLVFDVNGRPVAAWLVTVCRDFKGFPAVAGNQVEHY